MKNLKETIKEGMSKTMTCRIDPSKRDNFYTDLYNMISDLCFEYHKELDEEGDFDREHMEEFFSNFIEAFYQDQD